MTTLVEIVRDGRINDFSNYALLGVVEIAFVTLFLFIVPPYITGNSLHDYPDKNLLVSAGLIAPSLLVCRTYTMLLSSSNEGNYIMYFIRGLISTIAATFLLHVVIVLFGAPLTTMSIQPGGMQSWTFEDWVQIYLSLNPRNVKELWIICPTVAALFGTLFGAIPIPLDWDRPWQKWPLTCVYGAYIGFMIGMILFFCLSIAAFVRNPKKLK